MNNYRFSINKAHILLLLLFILLLIPGKQDAGNLELFPKSPRYHIVDESGEVILKIKKAMWIYNCVDCHRDFKTNRQAREMVSEHRELLYDHIKGENWCFACHYEELDKRNRIFLKGDIYRGPQDMIKLCSQCHGEKKREWEIGIHGKVTKTWLTYGEKEGEKMSCENCHSPHHPRSFKVKPFPGPKVRVERQGENHE